MKKTAMIAAALAMSLLLSGAALAEAPAQTAEPVVIEQTADSSVLDWLGQAWQTVSETVESGWNTVADTVNQGLAVSADAIAGAADAVEAFVVDSSDQVSNAMHSAWQTVLQWFQPAPAE